jgi:hypothetical protein
MNLGQLKKLLESQPLDRECEYGFGEPHSYRGYYDQVSFPPEGYVTIKKMLMYVERALREEFTGYKGGEFNYDLTTPVNFALYGECGDEDFMNNDMLGSILGLSDIVNTQHLIEELAMLVANKEK